MEAQRIKIPETATLKELIEVFNFTQLEADVEHVDPEFQRWLYDHKEWLVPKDA